MRTLFLLPCLLLCACSDNETFPQTHDPYVTDAATPLGCMPNLDGRIDAAEMQAFFGVTASFLVSPAGQERQVDVAGALQLGGQRVWDWSADIAGDQIAKFGASPVEGKWYASSFPTGTFVSSFDAGHTIDAVYRSDESTIYLLGLASAEENPPEGQTLMPYKDAVALYHFPLEVGGSWVSTGQVENGVFKGLQYAAKDTYEVRIDASGELRLPSLTFTQALRVRTKVTVQPAAGQSVTQQQVSFVFECFGEVARATSRAGETEEDFTVASEVRRLGIEP
ncbi:MAG TPA: hypothetical protein PLI95_18530 [Polyangiaceae bacterium]|nr:hypothetical protein [Polyangiaceae bacterium]